MVKAMWVVHSVHFALAWEARKPQQFFACKLSVALSMNVLLSSNNPIFVFKKTAFDPFLD